MRRLRARKPRGPGRTGAGGGCRHRHQLRVLPDTVREVVAWNRRPTWCPQDEAAAAAAIPVTVIESTIGPLARRRVVRRGGVLCWCCARCRIPKGFCASYPARLKPGGELRYFEHVASPGWRGSLQRLADATVWPYRRQLPHPPRDGTRDHRCGILRRAARHQWTLPAWAPLPGV